MPLTRPSEPVTSLTIMCFTVNLAEACDESIVQLDANASEGTTNSAAMSNT